MASRYFSVTVSVDSLEWTGHWLASRRCDLLSVHLAPDPAARPRIKLVAIESKARTTEEPIPFKPEAAPFDEAIDQVVATLDALEEILAPDADASLVADLKLTALFEHLASETLARVGRIRAKDAEARQLLSLLTAFSKRELQLGTDLELSGLAVVTQRSATVPEEHASITAPGVRTSWPVRIVRCGVPALRGLFEEEESGETPSSDDSGGSDKGAGSVPGPGAKPESGGTTPVAEPPKAAVTTTQEDGPGAGEVEQPDTVDRELDISEDTRDLIAGLEVASRLRRFKIEDVDESLVREGPTLVSVPVSYTAGESLRPIESATDDIARELGVPTVSVENDPDHPYHIRFLVPRRTRTFPEIPDGDAVWCDDSGNGRYFGIWLGAGVDGTPHRSFVSEWPHLLVAGTTGSGKTTFLKSMLVQLDQIPVGEVTIAIVDGKGEYDYVGLVGEQRFPERFPEVLLGHENATDVLEWLIEDEVANRRTILRNYFTSKPHAPRSPKQAYARAKTLGEDFPLSPIVVFIDEFAEIMLASGPTAREFENLVQRTVQAGRSALVHLVLATQRPDAKVLQGAIKANLPSRVALKLPSHHDSMTILGEAGAEDLLGTGDLVFKSASGERLRLQGFKPPL